MVSDRRRKQRRNLYLAVFLNFFLIIIDQIVKVWAYADLRGKNPFSYLSGTIVIEYAENRGAFLSLGAGLSEGGRLAIFVVGVFFILLFCIYSIIRSSHFTLSVVALSLIVAGGIGNLIDRIFRGFVVDYIHMGFPNLRTGVFNIADVAISTGIILMIFIQYKSGSNESEAAKK
ncbi:MAG: signal peptidase II [Oligoflexia bacterium]|nr:signal peptidase II [Oligoflexia bacterium]